MRTAGISLKKRCEDFNMEKKTTDLHAELKENRRQTLARAALTSIQPRGKYHGYDVFTWLDAPVSHLFSTFESMPFPIHWICTLDYFNVVVDSAHAQFPNVKGVYLLDGMVPSQVINADCQEVDSVSSALSQPDLIGGKGIIMLTGCGAHGLDAINEMALILKTIHGI